MMRKADYILKSSRIYKGTGRKLIDGFVAVKGEKIMFAGPFDPDGRVHRAGNQGHGFWG